jgi:hypothetical protein
MRAGNPAADAAPLATTRVDPAGAVDSLTELIRAECRDMDVARKVHGALEAIELL